jgi:hypothetical protein
MRQERSKSSFRFGEAWFICFNQAPQACRKPLINQEVVLNYFKCLKDARAKARDTGKGETVLHPLLSL